MLIRCPHCSSAYEVAAELFASDDRIVRCADCRECWRVEASGSSSGTRVVPLFGPEIVAEARSGRQAPIPRRPPRPHPRARLAGSLRRLRGAAAFAALGLAAVALMAGVARKEDVVRFMPGTAAAFAAAGLPVNLRGLALGDFKGALAEAAPGAPPVLTLEGRIRNLRPETNAVPRLRFSLRDKAQNELYTWTASAPKPKLGAGETIVFRSRLAAPPGDGRDLVVSFADAGEGPGGRPERP